MALSIAGVSLRRLVLPFLRSRRGGGMLIGCVFAVSLLASFGSIMSNYAWREAQWEELRAAVRAAVSATGPLLAGAGGQLDDEIEQRVADFVQGLLPGMDLRDVRVEHDESTGVTTVTVAGKYTFHDIWVFGDGDAAGEAVEQSTAVIYESDRYEVAVALDLTDSMTRTMPVGTSGESIVRIDGLKIAMNAVLDVVAEAVRTDPGSMMASVVPFGAAVNVADTATGGPPAGKGRTAAKERYVRMLAGPHASMQETLDAASESGRQWVDSFHHYGAGSNLGPLAEMSLPQDLLRDRDWNLRRENVVIDVGAQAPNLGGDGGWEVNDEDFWNGCVLARWGAHWDAAARPPGWSADEDRSYRPASGSVPEWTAASPGLPVDTPLHLADAPPDADDANTLFTAYSWPDARIGSRADHVLQSVQIVLLDGSISHDETEWSMGDNDWSFRPDRGGADLCPTSPVMPLTDDVNALRTAVAALETVRQHGASSHLPYGASFLHLGVVWGLRTLSPLWREIWAVADVAHRPRPGTPCAPAESAPGCDAKLNKSILIVTDGSNASGQVTRRLLAGSGQGNPSFIDPLVRACNFLGTLLYPNYGAAVAEQVEADFNNRFSDWLDDSGRFEIGGMGAVLDAFHTFLDRSADYAVTVPEDATQRAQREAALATVTPWQIFRGVDATGTDVLLDADNGFGFDGRPVLQHGHFCQWSSLFTSYGRVNDSVRVGDAAGELLEPVMGASPFAFDVPFTERNGEFMLNDRMKDSIDGWLREACRIAGQRRVRINAIFMGGNPNSPGVTTLKECITEAGGDADRDLYLTPTADSLRDAFVELFTVRRNLRFLD